MTDEMREAKRVDSQLFISFSLLNDMGTPSEGGMALALNISKKGVKLENRNPIEVATKLELILAVGNETIKVRGLVKYSDQVKDQYNIGVEFNKLSGEELALIEKYYPDINS